MNIAKDFVDALKPKKGTQAYDTTAQIVRIEDDTAWVHIPGGIDETPVKMTINATEGQTVQVRVADGTAFLVGNASAPPTDDRVANIATSVANTANDVAHTASNVANTAIEYASSAAQAASEAWNHAQDASDAASAAQGSAEDALEAAENAQASATNANEYAARALGGLSTVQSVAETLTWITQHGTMTLTTDTTPDPTHVYFVRDNSGDYQVGNYRYSIVAEPQQSAMSTYYELSIDESLNNYVGTHLALTGEGLWLLPASNGGYKVLIATGAGTTYTPAGTYLIDSTGGTMAKFTASEISIGEVLTGNYVTVDSDSLDIYHQNTQMAHFGYETGTAESGTATAPCYTLGTRKSGSTVGNYSVAEGLDVVASGFRSHAEGGKVSIDGTLFYSTASGDSSHAEGNGTTASGAGSHAEGIGTTASGADAHAEGNLTIASGTASHAEGISTKAIGAYSHAEGYGSRASGRASHAGGYYTSAESYYQTAIGKFNTTDANDTYALIIGNGADVNHRSNALTVDWNGEIEIGGQYSVWHEGNFAPSSKQDTITGGASTITSSDLTASKALVSNSSGKVAVSTVSSTELGYVSGVTSAIQTQLNGKQATLSVTISEPIGTDSTPCATGATITQGSVTFDPGTYLILVSAFFSSNSANRRVMYFSNTSTGSAIDGTVYDARQAVNGAASRLKFQTIKTFETSTTLYLRAYQNSGSELTFTAEYSCIKIF